MTADLKCTDSHNNISKYAKDAFDKKKAKAVIFQFDEETKKIYTELKASKTKGKEIYYYFTGRENKVFKL